MNYFIKLILNVKESTRLIYGFCVPTEQSLFSWRNIQTELKSIVCCCSIINENEKNDFIQAITNSINYRVGKYDIVLELRPSNPVMNSATHEMIKTVPVDQTFYRTSFWQIDKREILESIMNSFAYYNATDEFCNVNQLLDVIKEECGIDFRNKGDRIGNFEFFEPLKYYNSFRVENNGLCLCLEKDEEITEELSVSCELISFEHTVRNELKVMKRFQDKMIFESDDVISAAKINIWDSNGKLVYQFYMEFILNVSMNIWTTGERVVKDNWTSKLRKSSQRLADRIDKIEQIQMINNFQNSAISNESPFWYRSYQQGKRLFSFFDGTARGCFVPKVADKSGEIDSFVKVREYIEANGLKGVVLADPYFTSESIEKLLIRIGNTQAKVKIITSIPLKETDKNDTVSSLMEFTNCLKKNVSLIYRNCEIINVYRGENRVFHDRYLIRYHENDMIDGFMLSNSLNSAGQHFPFAVAPLENVVLLAVEEYLNQICDKAYQERAPKSERIFIQELFPADIQTFVHPDPIDQGDNKSWFPIFVSGKDDLSSALKYCADNGYIVHEDLESLDYTTNGLMWIQIIKGIYERWDDNPQHALFALGDALYHGCYNNSDISSNICCYPGFSEKIKSQISEEAPNMENRHTHKNINSDEYYYWALLNKQANAVSAFRNTHKDKRVFYQQGDGFWGCLYRLLLDLDFKYYLKLMEEVKSPLMLSIIYEISALKGFDTIFYKELVSSPWDFLHELGAKILYDTQNADIILSTIRQQNNKTQLEQTIYILSKLAFPRSHKMEEKKKENLFSSLVGIIERICNNNLIPFDDQRRILDHLSVNEKKTNAALQFFVADKLDDPELRNILLDKAIKQYQHYISNEVQCLKYENDREYFSNIAQCFVLRYPEGPDKQLLHWKLLDAFCDPCLQNYNHCKWVKAYNVLKADMILLDMLNNQKPLNDKVLQYYERVCNLLS